MPEESVASDNLPVPPGQINNDISHAVVELAPGRLRKLPFLAVADGDLTKLARVAQDADVWCVAELVVVRCRAKESPPRGHGELVKSCGRHEGRQGKEAENAVHGAGST